MIRFTARLIMALSTFEFHQLRCLGQQEPETERLYI